VSLSGSTVLVCVSDVLTDCELCQNVGSSGLQRIQMPNRWSDYSEHPGDFDRVEPAGSTD